MRSEGTSAFGDETAKSKADKKKAAKKAKAAQAEEEEDAAAAAVNEPTKSHILLTISVSIDFVAVVFEFWLILGVSFRPAAAGRSRGRSKTQTCRKAALRLRT